MNLDTTVRRRAGAWGATLCVALPLVLAAFAPLAPAYAQQAPPRKGFTTKQKVVALAGAALLYFLYRKYQANKAAQAAQTPTNGADNTTTATPAARPQLYRSRNGGVYYRNPQGKPVWLTVPNKPVQVPVAEVQQYAPNYRSIRGRAPSAPRGYTTQPFDQLDGNIYSNSSNGGGNGTPPGPGQ